MKKIWGILTKILCVLLSVACVFSCVACTNTDESSGGGAPKAPDYRKSATNNKEFTFYSYASVSNGKRTIKDENGNRVTIEVGPDCITAEKFIEYKACGLQILMPQATAVVSSANRYVAGGEKPLWLKILDLAEQTGLKVILTDNVLMYASAGEVSSTAIYQSDAAMDEYVRAQLMLYVKHPAFYGVLLKDEVSAKILKSGTFGKVYRSIKRIEKQLRDAGEIDKEIFIHINLQGVSSYYPHYADHPGYMYPDLTREEYYDIMTDLQYRAPETETDEEFFARVEQQIQLTPYEKRADLRYTLQRARYRKLVKLLLDETGADHFAIDLYPLYAAGPMTVYLMGLQIGAEIAKEYGVELHIVTQATSFPFGDPPNDRILDAESMRWLNNTLLSFGVDAMCYYGYFEPSEAIEGSTLMKNDGTKTPLWTVCQTLMRENRAFESTIMNFDYVGSQGFEKGTRKHLIDCVTKLPMATKFTALKKVLWDEETLLVNELYDAKRKNYMYAVMNAVDPVFSKTADISATLTFDKKYTHVLIWKNGKRSTTELRNGSFTVKLLPGEAVYAIPYK